MRLLVTRPAAAAAALAERLAALGHHVVSEPLLTILPEPDAAARLAAALAGAQAVLFTSANGVDAFAAATPRRDLPAFAVGDASARAARGAGFTDVESAGGDVADLAALVRARLKPEDGALVQGRGEDVAGDLAGALGATGFTVRPVALYRAEAATELTPATAAAIRDHRLDAALFFSPRTASSFVRLAAAAGLQEACAGVTAVALSPAVASALQALAWRRVAVAAEPTEAALLQALDRLAGESGSAAEKQDAERMSERGIEIEGTAVKPPESAGPQRSSATAGAAGQSSIGTPPRASVSRTPRSRRLLAALALLCLFLVAALASAPYWVSRFTGTGGAGGTEVAALQAKIDALQAELAGAAETRQRLAAAEQRLAGLEARGAPAADAQGAAQQAAQQMNQLADRLAKLEQRLASLDTGASADTVKSMQTEIQAVDHRLDEQAQALAKLQQSAAQSPDRTDAALLLAVEQLGQAIETSRPYEAELAGAVALARQRPEAAAALRQLEARASRGLPSLAILAERLERLAPALLNPATAAEGDWRSQMLAKLESLVSIRRVGPRAAEGNRTEAALAEAEAALKGGDLAGAVAAIGKLDGAAAETARPWRADAEARLQAEAAIAALDSALAQRFLGDQSAAGSKP